MSAHLETYLRDLNEIRSSGAAVPETSYYGALSNLLNEVGRDLKPRVRCILSLKNSGAGIPDGGLFTPDQFQKSETGEPLPGQKPSRGAIEVKGTGEEVLVVAGGEQAARYCKQYGQLLVTNLREFHLMEHGPEGKPVVLEGYRLAEGEAAFWLGAAHPRRMAQAHGERFEGFLKRVMLHSTPLASPQDVAWFLASYARDARARIEGVDLPALATVRTALEQALGIQFQGARGDHFFRSTLVQTLFYGLFSAWVLWCRQHPTGGRFDWQKAAWSLKVPMIRTLFEQVATPTKLEPLGLVEVLNWAGDLLDRVDTESFFGRFMEDHAVQYFYEPFLEAFDPELRKELGVWYTPPEIVKYMVARVDRVLREELGISGGLADRQVYVLDPCCGTGAYLVEVVHRIAETLRARGEDALLADDLKQAVRERVFGFEIMPAPFVVSHLQLGLLLQRLGAPLSESHGERAGVYLTNALTGWEPADPAKERVVQLSLAGVPGLKEERDAAEEVKRDRPILVVLGNPPYNGFAGMAMDEERQLSDAYRTTKRAAAPQGQGLNDLYVRFFRMAERRIVERSGRGVVCFISNYSWLDGLSFTGMRERYLELFDRIWIDNLHGDRKISEYAPDGRTSETVFALQGTSAGIKVGTAISVLSANGLASKTGDAEVFYRDVDRARADERRAALVASVSEPGVVDHYLRLTPVAEIGFPFKPREMATEYLHWPLVTELFPVFFPGVKTSRDDVVVDIDRKRLEERMRAYFSPEVSHEEMRRVAPGVMERTASFDPEATRDYLRKRGFLPQNVVHYCYRPFDVRWLFWESETRLLDRSRPDYFTHVFTQNRWLVSQQKPRGEWSRPQVVRSLGCLDIMDRSASFVPLFLKPALQPQTLFAEHELEILPSHPNGQRLNLSDAGVDYLRAIGSLEDAVHLFEHLVAVLHATRYCHENSGALRQDWPRIPLPNSREALLASAKLGREVAALLDPETPVNGVTEGMPRAELKAIATVVRVGGGGLTAGTPDLELTVGWGHAGQGGVTMPGQGRIVARKYTAEELATLEEGAGVLGMTLDETIRLLGDTTRDLFLNDVAYWKNVPARVWEYTIGGYQVIKKWLSYRERALLGRGLTKEEVREITCIARRIAALLLLEPRLDASYQAVKEDVYQWPSGGSARL